MRNYVFFLDKVLGQNVEFGVKESEIKSFSSTGEERKRMRDD